MSDKSAVETIYEGRFLNLSRRGSWEYVSRSKATGVVAVVALHDDGRIVLVEQYRPPVDARVIELPAGLAGDERDSESLLDAAKRELVEETGYVASEWNRLNTTYSSPGLTDEAVTFYLAQGLTRTGEGGGVGAESITIHDVDLNNLARWLSTAEGIPKVVDMKLFAGAFAAKEAIEKHNR